MVLKKFDLISPPIFLSFRGGGAHTQIVSGILTIISYLLISYFTVRYISEFITRKKPPAYYVNRNIEDVGIYNFNSTSFFHYIYITQKKNREIIEFDFDAFRIVGFDTKLYDNFFKKSQLDISHVRHWLYGYCDMTEEGKDLEDIIKK